MTRAILIASFILTSTSLPALAVDGGLQASEPLDQVRPGALVHVEAGPVVRCVRYVDGVVVDEPTTIVTRPMCGSDLTNVTQADLARWAQETRQSFDPAFERPPGAMVIGAGRQARGAGLDVVFVQSGGVTPPAGATAALEAAALYIESKWSDPITISINYSFANLGGGVIGSTGSSYVGSQSWATVRDSLIAGQDSDDTIEDFLPVTATIPVRYDGTVATVTDENRVFVTRANYRAFIGTAAGSVATMQFNSTFAFDFDPTNGVNGSQLCFQSVVIHEVGHAMGFTSGVDFRVNDIETIDIYRFQRTDGTGDFNPDNTTEFGTTSRLVDNNTPSDDHNSDLITVEYRMADGNPYQASHLREQVSNIGIMDPALSSGQNFWPEFYRDSDRNLFDAIGWDYSAAPADTTPPTPSPMTFATPPTPTSTSAVTMTATTATDSESPDITYFFEFNSGGTGGTTSVWQVGTSHNDAGLQPNTAYNYRVKARDSATTPNETAFSGVTGTATLIETPSGITSGTVTPATIELFAGGPLSNLGVGLTGCYFESVPPMPFGNLNTWVSGSSVVVTGLTPDTTYTFQVKARNQNGVETPFSSTVMVPTLPAIGDIDGDTDVDTDDILPFVDVLLGIETNPTIVDRCDLNGDTLANGDDTQMFIGCVMLGCP